MFKTEKELENFKIVATPMCKAAIELNNDLSWGDDPFAGILLIAYPGAGKSTYCQDSSWWVDGDKLIDYPKVPKWWLDPKLKAETANQYWKITDAVKKGKWVMTAETQAFIPTLRAVTWLVLPTEEEYERNLAARLKYNDDHPEKCHGYTTPEDITKYVSWAEANDVPIIRDTFKSAVKMIENSHMANSLYDAIHAFPLLGRLTSRYWFLTEQSIIYKIDKLAFQQHHSLYCYFEAMNETYLKDLSDVRSQYSPVIKFFDQYIFLELEEKVNPLLLEADRVLCHAPNVSFGCIINLANQLSYVCFAFYTLLVSISNDQIGSKNTINDMIINKTGLIQSYCCDLGRLANVASDKSRSCGMNENPLN